MANAILLEGDGDEAGALLPVAVALALASRRPFELIRVGEGREEPGLDAADAELLGAVARATGAVVDDARAGAHRLGFAPPAQLAPGDRELTVTGPAARALQALAAPLALAGGASRLTVRGLTHAAGAPLFHELALAWQPLLARAGFPLDLRLVAAGFEPGGAGAFSAAIEPAKPARPVDLRRRGTFREARILTVALGLPAEIPLRIATAASRALRLSGLAAEEESLPLPGGGGTGAAVLVQAVYEHVGVVAAALHDPREPAEAAGRRAAEALVWHHASGMALDPWLAAEAIVPLALASSGLQGGPTPIHRFSCTEITPALVRVARLARRFLPVEVAIFGREGEPGDVRVAPEGTGEVVRLHGRDA